MGESYGCWRKLAVDEMLWLADQNPGKISKKLKRTAGGKLAIRWEDPRTLARSGRKAQPSWANACRWLANRMECITKLLLSVEVGMATEKRQHLKKTGSKDTELKASNSISEASSKQRRVQLPPKKAKHQMNTCNTFGTEHRSHV